MAVHEEVALDSHALAREMAGSGTFQELTGSSAVMGANQVFRLWRGDASVILKVYGSDARERRESHALDAVRAIESVPREVGRGVTDGLHWVLLEDAGRWNLQTLPENPGLARTAGTILRSLHQLDREPLSNLARGMDQEWIAVDFAATLRRLDRYRARVGVSSDIITSAVTINPPYASEPVVAHTDPVPRNFVVDDNGAVTLISWEWATLAPLEWDLSRAVWSVGMHAGPTAAEALLEGYGKPIDAVQLDRWIVYHAAQTLVTGAERNLSSRPANIPSNLVDAFNRAVLGSI